MSLMTALHKVALDYRNAERCGEATDQYEIAFDGVIALFLPEAQVESITDYENDEGNFVDIDLTNDDGTEIVIRVLI